MKSEDIEKQNAQDAAVYTRALWVRMELYIAGIAI